MRISVTNSQHYLSFFLIKELIRQKHQVKVLFPYQIANRTYKNDSRSSYLERHTKIIPGFLRHTNTALSVIEESDIIFHFTHLDMFPDNTASIKSFLEEELLGTQTLLEELAKARSEKRLVYVSTGDVYGEAKKIPTPESESPIPLSPNLSISIAAEQIILGYGTSGQVNSTIIRLFNPYGPGQSEKAVIPTIVLQAINQSSSNRLINQGAVEETSERVSEQFNK